MKSRNPSIITAPNAPMVRAIERAKRNENAWRRITKIATGSQNLRFVRCYRIIATTAHVSGMKNIRFSPRAKRSAAERTKRSANAP